MQTAQAMNTVKMISVRVYGILINDKKQVLVSDAVEFAVGFVRDGTVEHRHFHEVLFRIFHRFGDCFGYLARFAQALTYAAFTVAYHYYSGEAERTTTFGYFGYAVERNEFFFETRIFGSAGIISFSFLPCHF